jgi:hypothetical protein
MRTLARILTTSPAMPWTGLLGILPVAGPCRSPPSSWRIRVPGMSSCPTGLAHFEPDRDEEQLPPPPIAGSVTRCGTSEAVLTEGSRWRRPHGPGMNVQPAGQFPFGQPTCHQGPSR